MNNKLLLAAGISSVLFLPVALVRQIQRLKKLMS